jgi:hypothetical protein
LIPLSPNRVDPLRGAACSLSADPSAVDPLRTRILVVIAVAFVAHLLEIGLYALAFFLMDHQFGLGAIEGATEGGALDFFYFSITTYTTMGFGDLSPHGPIRIVAGVEGLNGLLLIAWSASFTYLSMEKVWEEHHKER